jgi:hypothetical protein
MEFDFADHVLDIRVSDGGREQILLQPQSVADFYAKVMRSLNALRLPVSINDYPCEIPGAIHFGRDDAQRPYDKEYAHRFWQVLLRIDHVMKHFRTGFLGKSSPVHFFWGSFDLAVTRFSGRRAPEFTAKVPGLSTSVMREAYSHEVSSAGFWPGGNGIDYAAFYSYAYPTPAQFKAQPVQPAAATYSDALGEFLLPYDEVRTASDPQSTLLSFFQSTYEAAAVTGNWDRAALECALGRPGSPRAG